jgi:molybdenum cofactor cytidylyltransferase
MTVRCAGVLLAAGAGRRFALDRPGAKLDSVVDGLSIGRRAFKSISSGTDAMIVAVRSMASDLARFANDAGAVVIVPDRYDEGMGYSLAACAQTALSTFNDAEVLIIGLADMPWLRESTVRCVARAALAEQMIVQPRYAGAPGHPIAFPRRYWQQLARCEGDVGAKALIAEHRSQRSFLDVDDDGIVRDVDRPQDIGGD